MTETFGRWGSAALLAAFALAAPACRRGQSLPEVPGARRVVPFSAVMLFSETPVSTKEFDAADRHWKTRSTPRFDGGRLRSRPDADGGMVLVESPPKLAFKNRVDDCGAAADRRICSLPWEQAELTLCGRPLEGHLDLMDDKLADAMVITCRVLAPAREGADGVWQFADRDCTHALRVPLRTLSPQDFTFRFGDLALVADPDADYDRQVCERLAAQLGPSAGAPTADAGARRP